MSGEQSIDAAAPRADVMIAVEPDAELGPAFDAKTRAAAPARKVGQLPISWDSDADAARTRAHEQFRWFAGGWKVNAELPGPSGFAAATQFVRPEDVAEQIPCGSDVDAIVKAVKPFVDAGFTDVALVQIGGDQQSQFLDAARSEILPELRKQLT